MPEEALSTEPLLSEYGDGTNLAGSVSSGGGLTRLKTRPVRCCIWTSSAACCLVVVLVGFAGLYVYQGSSGGSGDGPAPTPAAAPDPPKGFRVDDTTVRGVQFHWDPPEGHGSAVLNYTIHCTDSVKKKTREITSDMTPAVSLDGLSAGTEYHIRVRAMNAVGKSKWSDDFSFKTKDSATPLAPWCLYPVHTTLSSLSLAWCKGDDQGLPILKYTVYYRKSNSKNEISHDCKADSHATGCEIRKLWGFERYYFRVSAWNQKGEGEVSQPFESHPATLLARKPDPPSNLKVECNLPTMATVEWNPPARDRGAPVLQYHLQLKKNGQWSHVPLSKECPLNSTAAMNELSPGTSYALRVASENNKGVSNWSDEVTFVTHRKDSPTAPTNVKLTATGSQLLAFEWDEPYDGGSPIQKYEVQCDNWWTGQGQSNTEQQPGNARMVQLDGFLLPDNEYNVRVRAVNAMGPGLWSITSKFRTKPDGNCGNEKDLSAFKANRSTMKGAIQKCLLENMTSPSQAGDCISKQVGISSACASCWVDEGHCTLNYCAASCIIPSSKKCADCSRAQCFPACVQCSGVPDWAYPP